MMSTSLRSERFWFAVALIAAALGGIAVIAAIASAADSTEPVLQGGARISAQSGSVAGAFLPTHP